jgi:FkbM family methyltransferase
MLKLSFFLTGRNRVYYNTKHEFKTILRFIDKINIFIDIGANQGFYSDLVLKNNDKANILLIEPNKKNFNFLKKKYLNKDNIKAFNIALGSNNKNKYFYSSYTSGLDSVYKRKFQLDHKNSSKFINFK